MRNFILSLGVFVSSNVLSQDTLPNFRANILTAEKASISWSNPYNNCTQISIQRSYDSLSFFKTIFSSLSPELPVNGFVDENYFEGINIYYRIFYVLENGDYYFTHSKTSVKSKSEYKKIEPSFNNILQPQLLDRFIITKKSIDETTTKKEVESKIKVIKNTKKEPVKEVNIHYLDSIVSAPLPSKKMYLLYIHSLDSLYKVIDETGFSRFKDSIVMNTKDTLYAFDNDIFLIKPFIPDPLWEPSKNIYTARKGNLVIKIDDYKKKKYKLIFYEENKNELFKINHIKQDILTIEKSNFISSGWYFFELYEDDKLKEKNKFFIGSDF